MQARDELVDYVCKKEMGVYSQIFAPVGDTAQLDRVGRALPLSLAYLRNDSCCHATLSSGRISNRAVARNKKPAALNCLCQSHVLVDNAQGLRLAHERIISFSILSSLNAIH